MRSGEGEKRIWELGEITYRKHWSAACCLGTRYVLKLSVKVCFLGAYLQSERGRDQLTILCYLGAECGVLTW